MKQLLVAVAAAFSFASFTVNAPADTPKPTTGTLEPGQAEAMEKAPTTVTLPATWTHPSVEARGVWITGQELLGSTESLAAKLDAFRRANLNEVMLDVWFRGYLLYPNSHIATQNPNAAGRDVLAWIIPEIHRRGMLASAWVSYGFYAYYTKDREKDPSMGPILDAHPQLTAVDSSGEKALYNHTLGYFYSMCPANPESHQVLADIATEVLTRYPFDTLNMDRMRFPSENFCYCDHCREAFQHDTGLKLEPFKQGTPEAAKFLQWKREQNAKAVATMAAAARKARPGIAVTAYVTGPTEMNSKAQAWDRWARRGLLDAIAVSMYGPEIRETANRARELMGPDASKLLLCALSSEQPHNVFLRNIDLARTLAPKGQHIWYSEKVLDDIEGLAAGPYSESAKSPLK